MSDFDERGNKLMKGKIGKRGGVLYIQPPKGWIRKGLNVSKIYDEGNDDWLSTNDKAWPVVFYGFRQWSDFAIPKVLKGGLRPGYLDSYKDISCSPDFNHVLQNYS